MENLPAKTRTKLLERIGDKYSVEPEKVLSVLKSTVFTVKKDEEPFTNEEVRASLILADQLDLNPFAREIYLARSRGKIVVIVPIDGWSKIVNGRDTYDGCAFVEKLDAKGKVIATECSMWRTDRSRPTVIEEQMVECYRNNSDPWKSHPRRMLRHKAFMQAARLCYGLGGIMDPDEAAGIRDIDVTPRSREMTLPKPGPTEVLTGGTSGAATLKRPTPKPRQGTSPSAARTMSSESERHAVEPAETLAGKVTLAAHQAKEDPERAGLKEAFEELWKQLEAAGLNPAGQFGVTDEAGDTLKIEDLRDLVQIMSESLAGVAT